MLMLFIGTDFLVKSEGYKLVIFISLLLIIYKKNRDYFYVIISKYSILENKNLLEMLKFIY